MAKLDSDEQRVVAQLLAEGQVASVTEAITPKDEPNGAPAAPKEKRKTAAAKRTTKVHSVDCNEITRVTRALTDAIDELEGADFALKIG